MTDPAPITAPVGDPAPAEPDMDAPAPPVLAFDALTLPDDPESPEFAASIQNLRSSFDQRQSYNAMVCDQLALRGVPPNGTLVRSIGAWGSLGHVQADVRAWYTGLAVRLRSDHARLPETAKRQANELIEQLWVLTQQVAARPLEAMQAQIAQDAADLSQLRLAAVQRDQDHAVALAEQHELLAKQCELTNQVREALARSQQSENELHDALRERDRLIANETLRWKLQSQGWDQERQRLMAQLQEAEAKVTGLTERLAAATSALQVQESRSAMLQEAVNTERARLDDTNRNHAIALDKFRVDARAAEARVSALLSKIEEGRRVESNLRDRIAQAEIELAVLRRPPPATLTPT